MWSGDTEEAEDHVDDTVILENGLPENRDGYGRTEDGRNIVNRTEHLYTLDLEVQDVGDEQCEDELQRYGHE